MTNHEAPDSVVQSQLPAFLYGCLENQEKRTLSPFLWIGWESGHAQCEPVTLQPLLPSSLPLGALETLRVLLFSLPKLLPLYHPKEIMFVVILKCIPHCKSHLCFQTRLLYNLPQSKIPKNLSILERPVPGNTLPLKCPPVFSTPITSASKRCR